MSLNNIEKFKEKIKSGKICVGVPLSSTDHAVSELVAEAGYDFTWIDTEHCGLNIETTLAHIMAIRGTDTAPFVRVPWNNAVLIKPILEFEPAGIIVPFVSTAAEAAQAVSACKYPPKGIRGFGPRRGIKFGGQTVPDYLKDADDRTMVIIQVEHIDAVKNIAQIVETSGLDGICIGPNDLSGSMGLLGQTDHQDVVDAIDTVIAEVKKSNIILGVATGYDPNRVRQWIKKGVQFIALNTDYVNMFIQCKKIADDVHSI